MSISTRSRTLCVAFLLTAGLLAGCTQSQVLLVAERASQSNAQPPNFPPPPRAHETATEAFLRFAQALHDEPFLVCTRAHESDTAGGYSAYNPSGPYYGAYQFLQGTWNYAAAHFGAPQFSGWDPIYVPGFWQDVVAWNYYLAVGNGPWAGRC